MACLLFDVVMPAFFTAGNSDSFGAASRAHWDRCIFAADAIPQQQMFPANRTCLVDSSTFCRYRPVAARQTALFLRSQS
jgi:hypothetical protein